jgi:hypothetical protein
VYRDESINCEAGVRLGNKHKIAKIIALVKKGISMNREIVTPRDRRNLAQAAWDSCYPLNPQIDRADVDDRDLSIATVIYPKLESPDPHPILNTYLFALDKLTSVGVRCRDILLDLVGVIERYFLAPAESQDEVLPIIEELKQRYRLCLSESNIPADVNFEPTFSLREGEAAPRNNHGVCAGAACHRGGRKTKTRTSRRGRKASRATRRTR